jgi:prophage tail gpP-like protein
MSEDMTIRKLAEKIAKDFQLSVKERTDAILELDAISYTNLGIDSTKTEKTKVKSDSKYLYKLLKGFNEVDGNLLLNHLDK